MIQVCSRCGTRWNVRDRQRVWCPRCQGALLAPTAEVAPSQWAAGPVPGTAQPGTPRTTKSAEATRLPQGYRWIAVRPGAAPPQRRPQRPLGPTPRYAVTPRWGLHEQFETPPAVAPVERPTSSPRAVRITVAAAAVVFGVAALVHIVRYALLLINRGTLLSPLVAGAATWGGIVVSVLAFFMLVATIAVLVTWLVNRRAAAYAVQGATDPRPAWQIWLGCLLPVVNLLWAPVFVIELARFEGRLQQLRGAIAIWWGGWLLSFLLSVFSIATSFTRDAQGIADNTVATIIAYLAALAALLLTLKVYGGFERRPVDRPVQRWVMVPDETPNQATPPAQAGADDGREKVDAMAGAPADVTSGGPVESTRDEPAT